MTQERRHEERKSEPRVDLVCTRLEWRPPFGLANVARKLLDVSTGGARVLLSKPLEAGEPVSIRLDAAKAKRSVSIPGEVRWVASVPGKKGSYVAGVRFMRAFGILDLLLRA